ncbi:hypothetical protein MTO96_038971 [Rhipicephalus appendiculatus]
MDLRPLYAGPPPTVPHGYFSVIDDAAFVDTGSRPPQGSECLTCGELHREGSLSDEFIMTMLWLTLAFAAVVFTGGVVITCLACTRRISFVYRHFGIFMILLGVVVGVAAALAVVVRTRRQGRSPSV